MGGDEAEKLIVIVAEVVCDEELASAATTVIVFAPALSVSVRFQVATLEPVAVSSVARTPLTVTDEMPLSPLPPSVAVPAIVMELVDTVCPLVWLVIVSNGPVESVGVPVVALARKLATMVRVLFRTR